MPDLPPLRPSLWTFRKIKGLLAGKKSRFDIDASSGDFNLAIVGESHYQDVLRQLLTSTAQSGGIFAVAVQCEPNNKFDSNAVRVSTADDRTIGYLARDVAPHYCDAVGEIETAGYRITCFGKLAGGDDGRPSIGVWIDLLDVDDLEDLKP
jgi:hypothetical protein